MQLRGATYIMVMYVATKNPEKTCGKELFSYLYMNVAIIFEHILRKIITNSKVQAMPA